MSRLATHFHFSPDKRDSLIFAGILFPVPVKTVVNGARPAAVVWVGRGIGWRTGGGLGIFTGCIHPHPVLWSVQCDNICLCLLVCIPPSGELLLQCEELNTELCSSLLSRSASLTSPADQSNPFGLYDYLLVYHPEEHTAMMELLSAIEKG